MDYMIVDDFTNTTILEEYINTVLDKEKILDNWITVYYPIPPLISATYLLIVWLGPKWMQDRPPYNIFQAMRLYNLFQICFNLYLILAFVRNPTAIPFLLKHSCSAAIGDDELAGLRYAFIYYTWGFMISKIFDLMDTVFMVLRKKSSHITFLHVYHHVAMVFFTWVTLKYIKAHQAALPGLLNVIIHVFMYVYYFLATFGPRVQRYLWWKKHLTKLQMGQFVLIVLYLAALYYYGCPISKFFTYMWLFNVIFFLCLFLNFYMKAYVSKPSEQKKQAKDQKSS